MRTANPKTTIDTHIKKKRQPKQNIKNGHQTIREENKRLGEEKKPYKNKPKTIKKMAIRTYILINALNVNGLNATTKRYRLAECIQK